MGHVRIRLTRRDWMADIEWRADSKAVTVKARSHKGAIKAATRLAKRLKPKADILLIAVERKP